MNGKRPSQMSTAELAAREDAELAAHRAEVAARVFDGDAAQPVRKRWSERQQRYVSYAEAERDRLADEADAIARHCAEVVARRLSAFPGALDALDVVTDPAAEVADRRRALARLGRALGVK